MALGGLFGCDEGAVVSEVVVWDGLSVWWWWWWWSCEGWGLNVEMAVVFWWW